MDKYRIPAVISIESDEPVPLDTVLAAFELEGVNIHPSVRLIEAWDNDNDGGRGTAFIEVDVMGAKDVMPILMGELIDFTRGTVDFTQVDYS